MLLIMAAAGFLMIFIVFLVYYFYFVFILRRRELISNFLDSVATFQDSKSSFDSSLENVSVIISTYNEEKIIERKINNISELNYPLEKLQVIVIDDASTDKTVELAKKILKEKKLTGKIIVNPVRIGLNKSLNFAVSLAKNNIVCITDSDVLLEKNALRNAVSVLQNFENAGGVTGRIQPVFEGDGLTQRSEVSYRGFYHVSMLAESSLHSAFPGNGPLIVYDKSKVPATIPEDYGSTDANIAMNIIRQGLRFIYIPNALVYEPSPENLSEHKLQKIRRAKRLLQVFIHNRKMSLDGKYGVFGRRIFPLKLLMFGLCPILFIAGLSAIGIYVVFSWNIMLYVLSGAFFAGALVLSLVFKRLGSLLSSFILHQFYLVIGLFYSFKKTYFWKTIDRKTRLSLSSKS